MRSVLAGIMLVMLPVNGAAAQTLPVGGACMDPVVTAPPGYTALPVLCSNEALQDNGMPCGLSPEAALRQAYQYCREEFYRPAGSWCDPTSCVAVNHSESYTLPACDGIAKRWESSAWKKADDAADAKMRQREIDHAKAFVEAVEKSK